MSQEAVARLEQRLAQGHRQWHAGDRAGAYATWEDVVFTRWAEARARGFHHLETRVLSPRWAHNIGHAYMLDAYLKLVRLGVIQAREVHLPLEREDRVGNRYLLDLFPAPLRLLCAAERPFTEAQREQHYWLREELDVLRLDETRGMNLYDATLLANRLWSEQGRPPLVRLPEEMEHLGQAFLRWHGIGPGDWFVGLHARAPGYNGASCRDCRIEDYAPVVRHVRAQGGTVIRLGDTSMPPAPRMDGLLDYAVQPYKDPRVDLYLAARCRYFIGSASGMGPIANLFQVPCLSVNWAPIFCRPFCDAEFYLPKRYQDLATGRTLSLQEVLGRGWGTLEFPHALAERGIRVLDNTPDQLLEAVAYFERVAVSGAPAPPEDLALQARYDAAVTGAGALGGGRILPAFARAFPETWEGP